MARFLIDILLLKFLLSAFVAQLVGANSLQIVGLTKDGLFRDWGPILTDSTDVNMVSICPQESYRTGFTVLCHMEAASYVHFRVDERWVRREEVKPFYISGNCGKVGNRHINGARIIYPWNSYPWGIVHLGCYSNNGVVINGTLDIACDGNGNANGYGNTEDVVALPVETPLQAIPPGITINITPTPTPTHENHEKRNTPAAKHPLNAVADGDITFQDAPGAHTDTLRDSPSAQSAGSGDVEVAMGRESDSDDKHMNVTSSDSIIEENGKAEVEVEQDEVEAIPPGGKVKEGKTNGNVAVVAGIDISITIPLPEEEPKGTPEITITPDNCVTKKASDYAGDKPAEWGASDVDSTSLKFNASDSNSDSSHSIGEYYPRYGLTYEFSVPVRSTYALIPDATMNTTISESGRNGVGWIWLWCSTGLALHKRRNEMLETTTAKAVAMMMMRDRRTGIHNADISSTLTTAEVLEPGRKYRVKIAGRTTGTTFHGVRMFPCEGTSCSAESIVWQKYSSICTI